MNFPLTILAGLALAGCTLPDNLDYHDRDLALERGDYRKMMAPRAPAVAAPAITSAPDFVPLDGAVNEPAPQPAPAAAVLADEPLVTLALDGSEPIADVLRQIAQQAGLGLEMPPGLTAPPVVFTARDRPLNEVVDRLADQTGLHIAIEHGVLRAAPDAPYLATYRVEYPNIARVTNNNISSSLNIANSETSGGNRNDSAMNTDSKSEADFWAELSANVTQILGLDAGTRNTGKGGTNFSINKQAGLVTVTGNRAQQRAVGTYLGQLAEASQAQVLIEARILEVELRDNFSSGINWDAMLTGAVNLGFNSPAGTPTVRMSPVPSATPGLSLNVTTGGFDGLFNFLQNFGTVRALSSPRMTVMQNQVGVIKVVRNEVYFRLTIQTTDATINSPQRRDVTSEQRSIPVGLIMNVQPSIDARTGRVTLAMRPTITRIADRVTDPGILIAASDAGLTPGQIDSTVPVVAVQEMDSVVSLQSGQTLVMGGLMRDATTSTTEGVPGTQDIPLVKYLANSKNDSTAKSELVVFLKATIVKQPAATIHPTDRDLYYGFGGDRRPIDTDPLDEAVPVSQPTPAIITKEERYEKQ